MLDGERRGRVLVQIEVEIIHTNELKTSQYLWAVQICGTEEWLDAFCTIEEAEGFCEENGYIVKSILGRYVIQK